MIDVSPSVVENIVGTRGGNPSFEVLQKVIYAFEHINPKWLINGEGKMLMKEKYSDLPVEVEDDAQSTSDKPDKKLIPFYEDAIIAGKTNETAGASTAYGVSEYINTGDWFREATAVIRHYGNSMIEYPSGSLLALKKVEDRRLLLWGKNYCIETTEFRVTKQLQPGEDKNTLVAYSSNCETYRDGRLIHAPITIPVKTIRSICLVLGCVVNEYSSGKGN